MLVHRVSVRHDRRGLAAMASVATHKAQAAMLMCADEPARKVQHPVARVIDRGRVGTFLSRSQFCYIMFSITFVDIRTTPLRTSLSTKKARTPV